MFQKAWERILDRFRNGRVGQYYTDFMRSIDKLGQTNKLDALKFVANIYEYGLNGEGYDLEKAAYYYDRAADLGDQKAVQKVLTINSKLARQDAAVTRREAERANEIAENELKKAEQERKRQKILQEEKQRIIIRQEADRKEYYKLVAKSIQETDRRNPVSVGIDTSKLSTTDIHELTMLANQLGVEIYTY